MADLRISDDVLASAASSARAAAAPVVNSCAVAPDFGSSQVLEAFGLVDGVCTAAADALSAATARLAAEVSAAQTALDATDRQLRSGVQ